MSADPEQGRMTDGAETNGHESKQPTHDAQPMTASSALSNSMGQNNPANPQNWPIYRKVMTSLQAWGFAFTVALGISCFSAGKMPFAKEFGLNPMIPEKFIAGFSLYIFGIFFAPWWTPHVTERIGRSFFYFTATIVCALFNLGAGLSHSVAGVLVCRFFAGFFGGSTLVLLEGTFADMWSAEWTNTYYSFQGLAAFFGAGLGPLVGGFLVTATGGWRWTQYFPVCLAAGALALGFNIPETYQREIPRRQAKSLGKTRSQVVAEQDPALSGTTILEMVKVTVINPLVLFLTQPVVTLTSVIMFSTFALTFQWFISVPAALGMAPPMGPGFSIDRIGLAFLGAVIGSSVGALTVIIIEYITNGISRNAMSNAKTETKAMSSKIEYRVIPAMLGVVWMTVALFWVGNTVNPNFKPIVPIAGTAFFVWGASMVTFSIIPYLFDSFQPAPTLAAITSQAVGRLGAAGFLPLVILQDITSSLTPKWGLGLFGFISLALWPIPVILFVFGGRWRENSKYSMMS